ncbi:hypothetical protein WJX75_007033 [Coccomyxa subellipsoidea]|uniref:Uncharacterized protein n=1 Tax=Coccomyxa subellipsoidea TaxID=248742 RepID=A0ABR2Z4Y6_9CHLO
MPYPVDPGQLAQLNVPTTNDLDEALRSNGLLAYVPSTDIGLQKPAQHLAKPAATTLPTGQSWAFPGGDLFSGDMPLASCPCFMCKAHGCSSAPVQFGTHPQAPPGSPGSFESEECSFRAPIPSSLAIAAALAAGEMPFLSRPEQLAVPPVTGMLPMSFTAALLMANTGVPMGQQPGQLCQTAILLPRRPLDLPLSSPSLLEGPSVPLALHQ